MQANIQVIFATAVFLITYALIVSEKIHRAIIAFFGAIVIIIAGIVAPERVIQVIDFNTIGLLVGMMIIVGITRETGFFEYLAIKAAKRAKGEPVRIMATLGLITAVLSALLDNVTTVLFIVPVTFAIAGQLQVNAIPFLIVEIIASNIGGTATLVGDPPNIMIGGATKLGFMDFVINLTPVVVVIYTLTLFILKLQYRNKIYGSPALRQNIMTMDEKATIKDYTLMKKCLFVLTLTVAGFVLHQFINLESSIIALSGAALLLLITNVDPEHAFRTVEWSVIFFFIGLFILVGALEEVGVIRAIATYALEITGGDILPAGLLILWLSAIASAFVDNIPFVATMIPLIQDMGRLGGIEDLNFLWWSLSLGACLGGNGTIIGASANVVAIGMAEKRGAPIGFISFFKVAFPLMIMSIVISMLYLLAWYNFNRVEVILYTLITGVVLALLLSKVDKILAAKLRVIDK